jgi:hypothetical protein
MRKIASLLVLLALPCFAGGAADYDPDTLAGMNAEVREDWGAAVSAFTKALAADPEDEKRAIRLAAAHENGFEFWLLWAHQGIAGERWRSAAICAGVAAGISPDDPRLAKVRTRLEKAGQPVPENTESLTAAHPSFPGRCPAGRAQALLRMGRVGAEADAIIDGCLDYLAGAQEPGGFYDHEKHSYTKYYPHGVAGLALLALLGDGPSTLKGPRGEAARKAAAYLANSQDQEGAIANRVTNHYPYCHAIATEALATYALLAGEVERLKPKLERARGHLLDTQNPGLAWRYGVRPGDNDTSVTYWSVAALAAVRRTGITVPEAAFEGALAWTARATGPEFGRTGYAGRGTLPARSAAAIDHFPSELSESMTAAGSLIRNYGGAAPSALDHQQRNLILKVPPQAKVPDMYYWHLGARALAAREGGVPTWWYGALVKSAIAHRERDGSIRPAGPWGKEGGRIYSTALVALALMSPYSEPPPAATAAATGFQESGFREVRIAGSATCHPTGIYLTRE